MRHSRLKSDITSLLKIPLLMLLLFLRGGDACLLPCDLITCTELPDRKAGKTRWEELTIESLIVMRYTFQKLKSKSCCS